MTCLRSANSYSIARTNDNNSPIESNSQFRYALRHYSYSGKSSRDHSCKKFNKVILLSFVIRASSFPLMDYDVQNFTRRCSATGRELAPGQWYYSVLVADGADLKRYDYSLEAWTGPPAEAIGYWKSQVPDKTSRRKHWAPNDIMLQFFDELSEQPDKQDMRYVLTLLLIRRRVFRLEEEHHDADGNEVLTVYCPRRDTAYTIPAIMPEQSKIDDIQRQLTALLE